MSGGAKRLNGVAFLRWSLAAFGVVVVVSAGVLGVWLYPWLRLPDEPQSAIEARWKKVEHWAEVAPRTGDDRLLLDAAEGIHGFSAPVAPAHDVPYIGRDQLDATQDAALDTFTRWLATGAPYVAPDCNDSGSRRNSAALPSFRLGQAALFTAHDADALPQVEAVLALARRQRRSGRLIDVAIGFRLAALAAEWSHARRVTLPPRFERYRPQVVEIRRGLARDVACMHRMMTGPSAPPVSLAPGGMGAGSRPPLGLVRMKRERLVFEQTHGRLLERAEALGEDWKRIASAYEHAASHHPKSVLLDAIGFYPGVIRKAGEDKERYDALVPRR